MAETDSRRRILLTQEAARLMVEEGIKDFGAAKRKAGRRLGGSPRAVKDLPTNREIQEEVELRLRMYRDTPDDRAVVRRLRETALEAMRFLAEFRPRLVGSVLAGTATEHSDVNLHLFADTAEDVEVFLHDVGIPFERAIRRHQVGSGDPVDYPAIGLVVDGIRIAGTIFPPEGLRQAPRSPINGKPVERAKAAQVEALLADTDTEPLVPGTGSDS